MSPRCPVNPPPSYHCAVSSGASIREAAPLADRSCRAFPINVFCNRYGIGRSKAYDEIKSGRLTGVKIGRRTLIREEDAERWLRSLPMIPTARVGDSAVVASDCLPEDTRQKAKAARNVMPRAVIHRKDGMR